MTDLARPFLKWVGGKRQLLPELTRHVPPLGPGATYYEPFVGGGALFWHLAPARAVLSDANAELMNVYRVVRDDVDRLIECLEAREPATEAQYLTIRAMDPDALDPVLRAARTIYLNRYGFNGLYRVNRAGRFNTPWGKRPSTRLPDADHLRACSDRLQGAELRLGDYQAAVHDARPGDFVYFDPPYHDTFTAYTAEGFNGRCQEQLAALFTGLARRGVHVVASNSDTPLVRKLYSSHAIHEVMAPRRVAADATSRADARELIIVGRNQ